MRTAVHFVAPTHDADLRVVLSQATRANTDMFGIRYRTQYGESREILWLTEGEANRRAVALRERGYTVVSGRMDI